MAFLHSSSVELTVNVSLTWPVSFRRFPNQFRLPPGNRPCSSQGLGLEMHFDQRTVMKDGWNGTHEQQGEPVGIDVLFEERAGSASGCWT